MHRSSDVSGVCKCSLSHGAIPGMGAVASVSSSISLKMGPRASRGVTSRGHGCRTGQGTWRAYRGCAVVT